MHQQIRRSQFLLSFGPGAILESKDGPRLIYSPEIGLFGNTQSPLVPEDFEIYCQRLSVGVLDGARVFRLPSNDELGRPASRYLYRTRPFPSWSLCVEHDILYRTHVGCPRCGNVDELHRRRQAIRFVRACPAGHIDDVDWDFVVHGHYNCQPRWYNWIGGGASLRDVVISCPEDRCSAQANLGAAYQQTWPCRGRYPEREAIGDSPRANGCTHGARLIQRQASNLYVPEVVTLFSIPPRATALHRMLEHPALQGAFLVGAPRNAQELEQVLDRLAHEGVIPSSLNMEIRRHSSEDILAAIEDVCQPVPQDFVNLVMGEFRELINASVHGAPPNQGRRLSSQPIFEVVRQDIGYATGPNGRRLRVVPISRLNTVAVLQGYRRYINVNQTVAELVDCSFYDSGSRWYPGMEVMGEGIFIMLDEDEGWHFPLTGRSQEEWARAYSSWVVDENPRVSRFNDGRELHPVFVWWHTFAHVLNRVLAIDSGYSAASIRERVYIEINAQTGRARGGIVLYTVQPGTDGTLGGLVSLVPRFQEVLYRVCELLRSCTNDPLCREQVFSQGRHSGASCFGCLSISETSCEHRNLWLDRNVMLEDMP